MLISQKKNKAAALALLLSMFSTVAHADCLGMQVHAHRGAGDTPENSLSALRNAYFGTWDGVETDLQLLADGNWVVYHDLLTGRVVDTGQPRAIQQMDSDDWRAARMKNHGALTAETPPFVADIADLATAFPEKTLNAQIRDVAPSCAPVESLVAQLRSNVKHGNWFLTSSVPSNLVCARRADPQGYLGVVVPDPRQAQAVGENKVSRLAAKSARQPKLDKVWLQRMQQQIGMPIGVHIDARSLDANPHLLGDAATLNMPVFVYGADGDSALAASLLRAQKRSHRWPSGVILNGPPETFCAMLE
ncbi:MULTISPECIES: glycerophosphodiester phosphodiesterase family protein [unclassified Janthinobacterium]|uniref:glycerophosphodiester phosphodiesterase n=1 Tax=unclassified Janthinobacterium TaxID=2610881 RepID=UPI001621A6F0|nr:MULTISPECIES: glycerophosphodiester phosphodiesterase family protein [unclassified Janthinobacterium]MBB5370238.1 glycerophosphoryl diester phosphodiesterase [Janthinobacterium sp. K2C7]MBB5383044.1 glycerophosphoryl diester phosphodiesterase [Janthinobacterium sp. K2Li3]MBB5388477.1 glycerophosphoryl diester phosphodiesterase [Janthinobacterium sp. K2E3]